MGVAANPLVPQGKVLPVCPSTRISIRGAREHNLKGFDLEIPRDKLVVITGLSGSGKSSLAFDTIYAEGQRRYVESLSAYARQFLGQMDKPDVDHIEGLSPAVSIDQKTTSKNPRSTVGTVTEIYDYLRLLYARIGIPHCPICGQPIERQTSDQIVDRILELADGTKFQVLAPVVRGRKGEYGKLLDDLKREGFTRVRVDKEVRGLDEEIVLDKKYKHDIDVVIDRLVMKDGVRTRLADSVETALRLADGTVVVAVVGGDELPFSQALACPVHGSISMPELAPRDFSFNSPYGACPDCNGLGSRLEADPQLVVPDTSHDACRGSDRALQPRHELLPAARGGCSSPHRHRRRHALGGAAREGPGHAAQRARRYAHQGGLPHARRPGDALVHALRGRARFDHAPLQGVRVREREGQAPGVHGGHPVQDVRRRAPEEGDTRGHRQRAERPRRHACSRRRTRSRSSRAWSSPTEKSRSRDAS